VAQLQRSISAQAGDAVALRPAADVTVARHQVQNGQVVAAYLPGKAGRLLVAGAQGTAVTQVVTGIFSGVAGAQGARLQADDVVPAAWALAGLLLLVVVAGNRRRAAGHRSGRAGGHDPIAMAATQAKGRITKQREVRMSGARRLATIPAAQERWLGTAAREVRPGVDLAVAGSTRT